MKFFFHQNNDFFFLIALLQWTVNSVFLIWFFFFLTITFIQYFVLFNFLIVHKWSSIILLGKVTFWVGIFINSFFLFDCFLFLFYFLVLFFSILAFDVLLLYHHDSLNLNSCVNLVNLIKQVSLFDCCLFQDYSSLSLSKFFILLF